MSNIRIFALSNLAQQIYNNTNESTNFKYRYKSDGPQR